MFRLSWETACACTRHVESVWLPIVCTSISQVTTYSVVEQQQQYLFYLCFVWYENEIILNQRMHVLIDISTISSTANSFCELQSIYKSHDRHTYIVHIYAYVCGISTRARNKYNSFYISDLFIITEIHMHFLRISPPRAPKHQTIDWMASIGDDDGMLKIIHTLIFASSRCLVCGLFLLYVVGYQIQNRDVKFLIHTQD